MTPKQQRFVQEYLVDLNATQAYLRAGYRKGAASSGGSRLLKRADVAAAVAEGIRARAARVEISADRVIREIASIAFTRADDLMAWGPGGLRVKGSEELSDGVRAAVAEVTESATKQGDVQIKIKLHDKLAALTQLGRHLGLFTDRVKHDFSGLTDAEIVDRATGVLGGVTPAEDRFQ